jgi:hypothetical protein
MITGQQTIEIGEVRCSIGFEDGFFQNEFKLILADYRRWGFCAEGMPEITIVVKEAFLPPPPPASNNTIFYQSMDYDSIHATLLFDTKRFQGEIGVTIQKDDKFTIVRITEIIETFICNAYIFYFGLNGIGTFIHSCGIADGEKGYIFTGPSEEGKSTIAKLSNPKTVLSDEMVLLRKSNNGRKKVYGTPFNGELEGINRCVDCKGIYFIEQGSTNEIIPISRMTSAITLLKEGIMGNFMSIEGINNIFSHSNYLSLLIDLLEGVPCYRLKFKKDNTFWKHINEQQ